MADYTNPLDSRSYVNKDYNTIWPEILDLIKKLTYRWDASISNESDPGVILAKLDAIIADKNDYNIDKNILETTPISVSQDANARAVFEQVGYNMHWYIAGTTNISMRFQQQQEKDEEQQELPTTVTIPRFSMVCNDDNSTVFAITEPVQLLTDGTTRDNIPVIQGTVVEYQINDERLITIDYLDNENRLYFNDTNVAENGIFISKSAEESYNSWKRVDNLAVEQLGQRVYKFGTLSASNTPYIEFPSDASDIIGDGIYITYIKTDGRSGNVNAKVIDRFYEYVTDPESGLSLNNDNVSIANFSAALDGKDPETVDDAYRNYKRVNGTFNTLVTLRDYANAIYKLGDNDYKLVCNDFVVDRTNDLQNSYYIITNQYGSDVEKLVSDSSKINAFNLKMCLLQYVDTPVTRDVFNQSFNPIDNITKNSDNFLLNPIQYQILDAIDEQKSIQHDFVSPTADIPLFFKNRFPIECRIIPNYKLTDLQQQEVQANIILALYKELYSRNIDFGEEISYDKVYDIITNADERINYVVLDDIKYGTFAVYYDSTDKEFKEILVSDAEVVQAQISSNRATQWDTGSLIIPDFTKLYQSSRTPTGNEPIYQYINGQFIKVPGNTTISGDIVSTNLRERFRNDIFAKSVLAGKTQLLIPDNKFRRDIVQNITNEKEVSSVSTELKISMSSLGEVTQKSYTLKDNESIIFFKPSLIDVTNYSAYVKYEFKAGTYETDAQKAFNNGTIAEQQFILSNSSSSESFTIQLNNYIGAFKTNLKKCITFYQNSSKITVSDVNLTIDGENKITISNAATYFNRGEVYTISYPYCTTNVNIGPNSIYKIGENESLTFYWKSNDDDNSYTYRKYGKDTIISPNFALTPTNTQFQEQIQGISGVVSDSVLNNNIQNNVKAILSASKAISIKDTNEANLKGVHNYCYWITSNADTTDKTYVLTLTRSGRTEDFSYVLRNNEYFMYTNASKSQLNILGSGTKIVFNRSVNSGIKSKSSSSLSYYDILTIKCPVSDYDEIVTKGVSTFTDDMWQDIAGETTNFVVKIVEQEMLALGAGTTINVAKVNKDEIIFSKNPIGDLTNDYSITYYDVTSTQIAQLSSAAETGLDWSAYTELALNCGPEKVQILESHTNDGVSSTEVVKFTARDNALIFLSQCMLVASNTLDYQGGQNIDLREIDIYGNVSYPSIMSYTEATPDSSVTYTKNTGIIKQEYKPNGTTYSLALPDGRYIIPIEIDNAGDVVELDALTVFNGGLIGEQSGLTFLEYDRDAAPSIHNTEKIENVLFYDDRVKVVTNAKATIRIVVGDWGIDSLERVDVEAYDSIGVWITPDVITSVRYSLEDNNQVLRIDLEGDFEQYAYAIDRFEVVVRYDRSYIDVAITLDKGKSITIYPLFKYTKFYEQHGAVYDNILAALQALDLSGLYNYTYEVSEDDLVENPLLAKSFLDKNHIYNQFTICQMDQNQAPQILNKVR